MNLIQLGIGDHAQFYLRDNWFLDQFAHKDIKYVLITAYLLMFVTWLLSYRNRKYDVMDQQAKLYGLFVIMALVSVNIVGLIKSQSAFMCPWDAISESSIGGNIWNLTKQYGHCFPGGHSSLGFSFMSGYFIFYKKNMKLARFYLVTGLILGLLMGWTQMLRGAHFFSHNLWSAWFVWATNIVAYPVYQMNKTFWVETSETLN